jgi:glutamate racemase
VKKRVKKIGVFDSGLGGLYIASAIRHELPAYDYVYLGDTLHVPYGRRSDDAIFNLCTKAMDYLFAQDCDLIVMACNTASASALRELQQKWLPSKGPEKRILGVIVPTLETAVDHAKTRIGLLATQRTVHSHIYEAELEKINPEIRLYGQAAPLLVPLIEDNGDKYIDEILGDYMRPLMDEGIESLILGCTHYVALKDRINKITGGTVDLISQDDIIPAKLHDYLKRHTDMESHLSQNATFEIHATDANSIFARNAKNLMGPEFELIQANY